MGDEQKEKLKAPWLKLQADFRIEIS